LSDGGIAVATDGSRHDAEWPSIAWQILAYIVLTAAEVLVSVTCLEFSYTQAPKKMKSFIMSLYLLSVSAGNVLTALASHAAAPYLYPSREQSREQSPELSPEHAAAAARGGADASWSGVLPSWRGMDVLVGLAEEIVAVELPELHAASAASAASPSLTPMLRQRVQSLRMAAVCMA
jgi:hypothetical protein